MFRFCFVVVVRYSNVGREVRNFLFRLTSLVCHSLPVGVTAVVLQTERQRAEMAVWMWDERVTNPDLIVSKAQEIASRN